jgi:hypothetical protein
MTKFVCVGFQMAPLSGQTQKLVFESDLNRCYLYILVAKVFYTSYDSHISNFHSTGSVSLSCFNIFSLISDKHIGTGEESSTCSFKLTCNWRCI